MNNIEQSVSKKHSLISYSSLLVGIICFFIVFVTPTRLAHTGNMIGDYITYFLTFIGILLSLVALSKETEKKIIPVLSLILSSSLFIFWIIALLALFTGLANFAP
ncbi:hypothetical protein [Solibacillus sp. FSL K6-4121]|uniref:hypothetical protein n=1 Tax=Solibacillus sp. FSL K6-4121 TaxID=2921505 RepID=UPI004046FBD0